MSDSYTFMKEPTLPNHWACAASKCKDATLKGDAEERRYPSAAVEMTARKIRRKSGQGVPCPYGKRAKKAGGASPAPTQERAKTKAGEGRVLALAGVTSLRRGGYGRRAGGGAVLYTANIKIS